MNFLRRYKLIVFILVAAAGAGSIPAFAKVGLEVFGPFTLVSIRFFFAAIVLLPFAAKLGGLRRQVFREQALVALVGAFNPIILFIGLQFTKASVTPVLYAAIPAMTAAYFWIVRGKKISVVQQFGVALGFAGVSLIALLPLFERGGVSAGELGGNVIMFGAVIAFFVYTIMSKQNYAKTSVSPLVLTFWFTVVTFILSLPFAAYEIMNRPDTLGQIGLIHILSGAEIGIVGTSIGYIAYQSALRLGNEMSAAVILYLQPVVTFICAWILLGEKLTVAFGIGVVMALVGAQIASGISLKRTAPTTPGE